MRPKWPWSRPKEKTALASFFSVMAMRSLALMRFFRDSRVVAFFTRRSNHSECMYWVLSLMAEEKRFSSKPLVWKRW